MGKTVQFMILAMLLSCNIFNPNGEGDPGQSAEGQISLGQTLFNQQQYEASMNAYAKAIAEDSTRSMAYYGYSKAAMQLYDINASQLLKEFNSSQSGNLPFLGQPDTVKTNYLQAMGRVKWALGQLTKRDTLTRWWKLWKNIENIDPKAFPKDHKRASFMDTVYFTRAEAGMVGYYPLSKFPLSDMAMSYTKIAPDQGLTELIYSVLNLQDFDDNDTIDDRDQLLTQLSFNLDEGFKVDSLSNISDSLSNPQTRDNVNNMIKNVSEGIGSAGNVVNLLGSMLPGGDTDSSTISGDSSSTDDFGEIVTGDVDSIVSSMGSTITFYQFGDGMDNDGDGCIDEEILDGKDNDGDGFTDEDARVTKGIQVLGSSSFTDDGIDNDKDGDVDEADELVDINDQLIGFTKTNFIKGDLYKDKAFKSWVQQNATEQTVIDSAKVSIGGCWRNY